jgi:predicted Zn finger-like uncharacterized protein
MTIVTCPACRTRFRVDEEELGGPAGRDVRCANCGHSWRQTPPGVAPRVGGTPPEPAPSHNEAAVAEVPASPPAPGLVIPPREQAPPGSLQQSRHGRAVLGWIAPIVLVALFALAVLIGTVGRDRVVAIWPSTARFYAWVGSWIEPSGPGLVIGKVTPTRNDQGLVIDGEIANLGSTPRDVPRLRLALRDATEKEVQSEIVDPPRARLQPGEIAHFSAPFAHPPDAATGVVVTFAPP